MEFKESKAIYLQIAERISHEILLEKYAEDERIPSVREYAAVVEVNVNTVMRSYEYLQQQDIIYNKRGIGYFVSLGAKKHIYTSQRDEFIREDLPLFFKQIDLLEIPVEQIVKMYNQYVNKNLKTNNNETYN